MGTIFNSNTNRNINLRRSIVLHKLGKYVFLAVLALTAAQAFGANGGEGNNTGCNGQGNSNSPCTGDTGVFTSSNGNTYSFQHQRQSQGQAQSQTANGGAGGTGTGTASAVANGGTGTAAATSNNSVSQSTTYTSPDSVTVKNVPAVIPPSLVSTSDTCMGSTSGGVAVAGFGFSVGGTWKDDECINRLNSRELRSMGEYDAAKEVMCSNKAVRAAFARLNKPCLEDAAK